MSSTSETRAPLKDDRGIQREVIVRREEVVRWRSRYGVRVRAPSQWITTCFVVIDGDEVTLVRVGETWRTRDESIVFAHSKVQTG